MTQVSRYPISPRVDKQMAQIFRKTISSLKQSEEIDDFLDDFLSPVEKIMLTKRLAIAVMLAKGYDYSSIKTILHVTPSTIAAVSIRFKYSGRGYKKAVEKILQDEAMGDFWQRVEQILSSIPPSKGSIRSRHQRDVEKKKLLSQRAF